MKRRTFLGSIPIAIAVSGCTGEQTGGFGSDPDPPDDEAGQDDGDELEEKDPEIERLEEGFAELGVDVKRVEVENETIEVRIQTSGNLDNDIASMAGAYATMAPDLDRDLSVVVEDRGLTVDSFRIEHEWALDFANGRLSDEEFVELIRETTRD